jgi:hypothetical protein
MTSVERRFLDWKRPIAQAAADHLVQTASEREPHSQSRALSAAEGLPKRGGSACLDLSALVVAVPTSRFGRRLLELLAERAQDAANPRALIPPKVVTIGALADTLWHSDRRRATHIETLLAWASAIMHAPEEVTRVAVPPADRSKPLSLLAAAELLSNARRALVQERLSMRDAAKVAKRLAPAQSANRWASLAVLEESYERVLDSVGLTDALDVSARGLGPKAAVGGDQSARVPSLFLVAPTDIPAALRHALQEPDVTAAMLIWAPSDMAGSFDAFGVPRPELWSEMPIALDDACIRIAERPRDQAAETVAILAQISDRFGPDDVSVCLTDPGAEAIVTETLRSARVAVHSAYRRSLAQSRPARLLTAVADYLDEATSEALARLVRHPDMEPCMRAGGHGDTGRILTDLDLYRSRRLAMQLPRTRSAHANDSLIATVAETVAAVDRVLRPFRGTRLPLPDWAEPMASVLAAVYDPVLDQRFGRSSDLPDQNAELLDSLEQVAVLLRDVASACPQLATETPLTASEAIRLACRMAQRIAQPEPVGPSAVELLNWFELPYDDAAVKIICGLNEGFVPERVPDDPLLPDPLRRELGLPDSRSRYARDAHHMSAVAASTRELAVIVGRMSAQGDPLRPSRLLFACPQPTLVERARRLFGTTVPTASHPLPYLSAPKSRYALIGPETPHEPIRRLNVTAFRDYLQCPYRFYLRHVVQLESLNDDLLEMDAALFGSLIHDALGRFGRTPEAHTRDEGAIADALGAALDEAVTRRLGTSLTPAVALQVYQARARLRAFARWQARRVAEDWYIMDHGAEVDAQAAMDVDGEPFEVYGRIDRIEHNARTGEYAIFDYKSADALDKPERTHRRTQNGVTRWLDLQLPLYRRIAPVPADARVQLGYIWVGPREGETAEMIAEWSDADLDDAITCAVNIIRSVRIGRFWPPNPDARPGTDGIGSICMDGCADRFALWQNPPLSWMPQ